MNNNKRLEAFEEMLTAVQENYETTVTKLAQLKEAGKEKTVTYRQLLGNKLQLQDMLSMYRVYGLLDNCENESH